MTIPSFAAGEKPSAPKIQQLGYDDTYTPVLTASSSNPDLGTDPTEDGIIWVNGQWVHVMVHIVFGTSPSVGSGTYQISLPAAYPIASTIGGVSVPGGAIGVIRLIDTGTTEKSAVALADVTNNRFELFDVNANGYVTNSAPWTPAAGDSYSGIVSYPTDFGV